jgi:hypothetical protein
MPKGPIFLKNETAASIGFSAHKLRIVIVPNGAELKNKCICPMACMVYF